MLSTVIKTPKNQMTLDFEGGLTKRYRSLLDCVASGVYKRGLTTTAIDLDVAPSNLSVQISEDPSRKFSIDSLEKYIETSDDLTPVYYLVEKFLSDKTAKQDATLEAVGDLVSQLMPLIPSLRAAGLIKD